MHTARTSDIISSTVSFPLGVIHDMQSQYCCKDIMSQMLLPSSRTTIATGGGLTFLNQMRRDDQ